tara:strand:+ start:2580 stop:3620 length:1041 start_codon:yes stop_codon:yes gene_type:complete
MSQDNVQEDFNSGLADASLSLDEAAEAILANWTDAEQPSEKGELEATDETTDETDVEDSESEDDVETEEENESEEDPDESDTEEADEEEEEVELEISDDTLVELTVDGETKQASLKDLKRLYGQEASLTRKSQETANQKKEANEAMQRADASLQAMLKRAQDRYKPYQEVDMLLASRQMEAEDFAALRQEAQAAESDLKFLTEEANSYYGEIQQKQLVQQQVQAKECIEVLKRDVPDWSTDLYNEIRSHAISNGLPEDSVNNYTDPSVIKILHKAMMFDQGKKVAKAKKANKAPTKVLRSKKAPPTKTDIKISKKNEMQNRLRANQSGVTDLDDIADALMANWDAN